MKRLLGSLAIGIFPAALVVAAILPLKILFPGSGIGISLLWFFLWPAPFLLCVFPSLTSEQALWLSFPLGLFLDIAVVTLLAYLAMRTIRR